MLLFSLKVLNNLTLSTFIHGISFHILLNFLELFSHTDFIHNLQFLQLYLSQFLT